VSNPNPTLQLTKLQVRIINENQVRVINEEQTTETLETTNPEDDTYATPTGVTNRERGGYSNILPLLVQII